MACSRSASLPARRVNVPMSPPRGEAAPARSSARPPPGHAPRGGKNWPTTTQSCCVVLPAPRLAGVSRDRVDPGSVPGAGPRVWTSSGARDAGSRLAGACRLSGCASVPVGVVGPKPKQQGGGSHPEKAEAECEDPTRAWVCHCESRPWRAIVPFGGGSSSRVATYSTGGGSGGGRVRCAGLRARLSRCRGSAAPPLFS